MKQTHEPFFGREPQLEAAQVLFLRRQLGSQYLDLLRFSSTITFMRSECPSNADKLSTLGASFRLLCYQKAVLNHARFGGTTTLWWGVERFKDSPLLSLMSLE